MSGPAEIFARDGVALLPGLFAGLVEDLRDGVAQNMALPGPYGAENTKSGDSGRFFDDYCNWQRIGAFERAARDPAVIAAAGDLMGSRRVQMFHDHVLVKEPGTSKPTPWHQDAPYYFVEGMQAVSFWVPLDPVEQASLRCVAGSHLWPRLVYPTRWLNEDGFYAQGDAFMPVPDPDAEGMRIVEHAMQPGDALAFHFRTLHGARGNHSAARRRAFSLRLLGDDTRYCTRPGPTSPPFPGHGMKDGERLREDWFPLLRGGNDAAV